MSDLIILSLSIIFLISPFFWWMCRKDNKELRKKIDEQKRTLVTQRELELERAEILDRTAALNAQQERLDISRGRLEALERSLAPLESEQTVTIASGSPVFEFEDSDRYKEAITECKEMQKSIARQNRHVSGPELKLEGDSRFHRRLLKLVLLAYTAASDDARHSVRWNNYDRILARFDKQRETINSCTPIQITERFHRLKKREIELTYYREEIRQREREEKKELAAQMREEARVEREIEQARKQAERDAKIAVKAVAEAEARLESANQEQRAGFEAQLELLRKQLADAEAANTRAMSMAQQTKRGHIYIISNVGSFGENIYKVGMTRRIIPEDRVKELGDASVPFPFDTHAMIESDDAPAMEAELHRMLNESRVNRVNTRKEFFSTTLENIKSLVRQHEPGAEFIDFAEAREYRETQAFQQNRVSVVH